MSDRYAHYERLAIDWPASGTKSEFAGSVTLVTKSKMAALAPPSFQDGRGSPGAAGWVSVAEGAQADAITRTNRQAKKDAYFMMATS